MRPRVTGSIRPRPAAPGRPAAGRPGRSGRHPQAKESATRGRPAQPGRRRAEPLECLLQQADRRRASPPGMDPGQLEVGLRPLRRVGPAALERRDEQVAACLPAPAGRHRTQRLVGEAGRRAVAGRIGVGRDPRGSSSARSYSSRPISRSASGGRPRRVVHRSEHNGDRARERQGPHPRAGPPTSTTSPSATSRRSTARAIGPNPGERGARRDAADLAARRVHPAPAAPRRPEGRPRRPRLAWPR